MPSLTMLLKDLWPPAHKPIPGGQLPTWGTSWLASRAPTGTRLGATCYGIPDGNLTGTHASRPLGLLTAVAASSMPQLTKGLRPHNAASK